MNGPEDKKFDFDVANLADQVTLVGEIEHAYYHALKSASSVEERDAIFYLTIASMLKDFRRRFMRERFPNIKEEDWCLLKALETIRQRTYESANDSYKDIKEVNDVWALVMEHIFGIDMSGCSACRAEKQEENE